MATTGEFVHTPGALLAIAPGYAHLSEEAAATMFPTRGKESLQRPGYVAVVQLVGSLWKHSLVEARQKINSLAANDRIGSIVILVDSPGGTVSGTHDLYEAVSRAAALKPVYAFIEDMGASGAYYAIAGATRIFANTTALVGSLGVYTVTTDASAFAENMGVKPIVVRAGKHKGAGVWGTKVTAEQIEHLQRLVDAQAQHFVAAVARGRRMKVERVSDLADGSIYVGSQAVAAGLVDEICSLEDMLQRVTATTPTDAFWALDDQESLAKVKELATELAEKEPSHRPYTSPRAQSWHYLKVQIEHPKLFARALRECPDLMKNE
jgi:protease IV